jgi:GH43 family beta-xylosidase
MQTLVVAERLEARRLLTGLTGQYFDRVDFTDLKATRTDAAVDFTWAGSPVTGVQADAFAVRWTGQVEAQFNETYTLYVTSDDGARLWVDGRLLIDNWVNQSAVETSAAIPLQAGKRYDIRLDYYDNTGGAQARLSWASPSLAKQVIPSAQLFPSGSGLLATYFDNVDFTAPRAARTDASIDFNWASGSPDPAVGADTFSARWTGQILPQYSQTYGFDVPADADATVRLRIDGKLIVDSTSVQDPNLITLEAGKRYDIQLDYSENTGSANVQLFWSSPSQPKQIVPNSRLFASTLGATPTKKTTYTNSVQDRDLPDPGVIYAAGYYWMVHTMGGPDVGWPLYKSSDMVTWTFQQHLLTSTNKPAWMTDSFWAPEIHKVGTQFVATGTAYSSTFGHLCIAIATAPEITGPYTIKSTPIVTDTRNVLDSHIFVDDDGSAYLVWKRDGPTNGQNGSIRIRKLDATLTSFAAGSVETQILDNSVGGWEKNLAEAPWMLRHDGYYYLFYSGAFIDTTYSEGVARATSPLGPFTRSPLNPILTNNTTWGGPGHGGFVDDADGVLWFLYHARHQSNPDFGRVQMLDKVTWTTDEWPILGNRGTPSVAATVGPRVLAPSGAGRYNITGDVGGVRNDALTLVRDSTDSSLLDVILNGVTQLSLPFGEIQTLTIDTGGGDDSITLDYSRGDVVPGGGVTLNGSIGNDALHVVGDSSLADAIPGGLHASANRITRGTGAVRDVGIERLDVDAGSISFDGDVSLGTVAPTIDVAAGASARFTTSQHLAGLNIADGALAAIAGNSSTAVVTPSLSILGSGRLDLGRGLLIVDYTGASPAASVRSLLVSGRAGGAWTGPGIDSSAAASSPGTAVGYGEASDLAAGGTFGGQSVDTTAVLVRYTVDGDANLDRTVDLTDFTFLATNFNGTNKSWSQGDFNYDGTVDLTDFTILASRFNQTLPADDPTTAAVLAAAPPASPFATTKLVRTDVEDLDLVIGLI